MTDKEQIEKDMGELLIEVTPTLKFEDIKVGESYLLPTDNVKILNRLVIKVNKKTKVCLLKTVIVNKDDKSRKAAYYDRYNVHYSWLRDLNHKAVHGDKYEKE